MEPLITVLLVTTSLARAVPLSFLQTRAEHYNIIQKWSQLAALPEAHANETQTSKMNLHVIKGQYLGGVKERLEQATGNIMSRASHMLSNIFIGKTSQKGAAGEKVLAKNELREDWTLDRDDPKQVNVERKHLKRKETRVEKEIQEVETARADIEASVENAKSQETLALANVSKHGQPSHERVQKYGTLLLESNAQLDVSRDAQLGLDALLNESSQAMNTINEQINEFKKAYPNLMKSRFADQMRKHAESLAQKHDSTTFMRRTKADLKSKCDSLQRNNSALRMLAIQLEDKSALLKEQMETIQSNITLAEEFLLKADADNNYANDTAILRELNETESRERNEFLHSSALQALDKSVALLQTEGDELDFHDYIQLIEATYGDLHREREADLATLEQRYESDLAKEAKIQDALQKQISHLQLKQKVQQELHEKLEAAISHLELVIKYLQHRIRDLQRYATMLSIRNQ